MAIGASPASVFGMVVARGARLLAAGMLACVSPARRAARISPIVALRQD